MSTKTRDREPLPAPAGDDENFLRRWSRRKHEAEVGEGPGAPPAPAPVAEQESPPAPVLTDADMPPIESLTPDSDFSGFMSPGVSEALRQQALRVLFRSPALNIRCPLDSEYYDCANMTPLGSIITHEMRDEMEREARKKLAALGREVLADESAAGAGGAAMAAEQASPAGSDDTPNTNDQGGQSDA